MAVLQEVDAASRDREGWTSFVYCCGQNDTFGVDGSQSNNGELILVCQDPPRLPGDPTSLPPLQPFRCIQRELPHVYATDRAAWWVLWAFVQFALVPRATEHSYRLRSLILIKW